MAKHKITTTYSATWEQTETVEIPDGMTEDQLTAWLNSHQSRPDSFAVEFGDVECDDIECPSYVVKPPGLTLRPVPEEAWISFAGGRWATDGYCLVREGSPMPATMHSDSRGWLPEITTDAVTVMVSKVNETKLHPGTFHPRFAPVFDGAAVTGGGPGEPAGVYRDGLMVAVVMPFREGTGTDGPVIRPNGAPVSA